MALTDNLVSYWKFDGDATDEQTPASDGVLEGSPTFTTGKFGQALTLDGASVRGVDLSSFIDASDTNNNGGLPFTGPSLGVNPVTISMWFKIDNLGAGNYLMSWYGGGGDSGGRIGVGATGKLVMRQWLNGGGNNWMISTDGAVSQGSWVHLVYRDTTEIQVVGGNINPLVTVGGHQAEYWVNGVQDTTGGVGIRYFMSGEGTLWWSYSGVLQKIKLGIDHALGSNTASVFNGQIEDVAIWGRALTDAEIGDIYTRGVGGQSLLETTPPVDGSGFSITVV